ncbi:Serine/threonine-protein kinase STY17, variant 2 [Balamuthia mandrillaris]
MMLGEAATPSAAAMVVTAASRSAGGGEPSASPSLLATSPPGLPPNELSASSSSPSSSSPQHKKPRNHSSLLSSCSSSSCCSSSCSSSSCELQRQKIGPLQEPPNYAYFSSSSSPYSTIAPGVYLLDEPLPPSSSSTTKLFLSSSSSSSSSKRKRTDSSSSSSRGEVLLEELQKLKLSLKPKYVLSYDDLAFEEELGAGFFGIVYKGRLYHNNHNGGNAEQQHSTVAIKKITRQTFRNENEIQLFKKEFEILAKLRHDHIIRFIGVGISEATGEHCIVTEYMAGGSLRQYLDHSFESLTETMRRSIARGVASAMKYLHNHEPKIIHRDLSSSNILLDEDPHMAKISDLGLARFLDAGSGMMTCAVGALAWMAPGKLSHLSSLLFACSSLAFLAPFFAFCSDISGCQRGILWKALLRESGRV